MSRIISLNFWDPSQLSGFLERLRIAGGYNTVPAMIRTLSNTANTAEKWKGAQSAPATLLFFLQNYAKVHGYDATALCERWELTASTTTVVNPAVAATVEAVEELGHKLDQVIETLRDQVSVMRAVEQRMAQVSKQIEAIQSAPPPRRRSK